jgi:hypothetical protein
MKRLPVKHGSLVTPEGSKDDINRALKKLGVGEKFDNAAIEKIYFGLSKIIGRWFDEQSAKEASPVAKALSSIGKELIAAVELLGGHEDGLHTHVEIESTSYVKKILALDPTVGSIDNAEQVVRAFRDSGSKIGHACMVAYADLASEASKGGREKLDWYDDFTDFLLDIAEVAGVEPKNIKDRASRLRSGWLFEAAQAFEPFLYISMRSPSAEACGKRLERSKKASAPYTTKPFTK